MGEGENLSQSTHDYNLAAPPQQPRAHVNMVYERPDDFDRMGAGCLIVQHLLQLGDLAAIDGGQAGQHSSLFGGSPVRR